jgi:hypothetical protein
LLDYEGLSPGVREKIEDLARQNGWSIDRTVEELVIEGIAMGGLTLAVRPKAKIVAINTATNLLGQKGPTTDPN